MWGGQKTVLGRGPSQGEQAVCSMGIPMEQLCLRQMTILSGSLGDCVENGSGSVPGYLKQLQATGDECWSLDWGPSGERVHCLSTLQIPPFWWRLQARDCPGFPFL